MIVNFLAGARRGLDTGVYRSWQQSLATIGIAPGSLLAWATAAEGGFCIAANGVLSIGSARADGSSGSDNHRWQHIGWHRIERGGFDADNSTLRWHLYPDDTDTERSGSVVLDRPGRVPVVFRDRVAASIIVEQFIPLSDRPAAPGRRVQEPGVIISGRRDLADRDARLQWHASLPQGGDWGSRELQELAAESITRLRSEYDPDG